MEFFSFSSSAQSFLMFASDNPLYILSCSLLIGALCFALVYVFEAMALYTIAKKNGFEHKWMAFVPIINTYYIGVLADKNKVFNFSAKTVSLITSIAEGLYCIVQILFYFAMFTLATSGFLNINYTTAAAGGETLRIPSGFYVSSKITSDLLWAEWMATYMPNILSWWIELVYLAFEIMLLILFFQTYSARHYVLFTLCSVFFPLKGVLFFIVRNNKGVNYRQYMMERQARQYAMYQQYNRQNMNDNPYNYNPYSGRTQPPPTSNPYEQPHSNTTTPSDPFEEFSNSSNNSSNNSSSNSSNNSSGDDDPFNFN
jgi:hypothetical protein